MYKKIIFFIFFRFLLSLSTNSRCLAMDDELTVLPLTSKVLNIEPINKQNINFENEEKLNELKGNLRDTQPVSALISCCKTLDQVKFF